MNEDLLKKLDELIEVLKSIDKTLSKDSYVCIKNITTNNIENVDVNALFEEMKKLNNIRTLV